ncbi:hypothetical protein CKO15_02395 [Halorhodospira abdelmalekii]|uniref:LicD family protein n=1 Tax=Halorhodospira abdelmalekii TaxID=421629 RepID=UPI0019076824|nr:LicD family protein [Halorhodospira abdelmalekii]MBK1734149.1 hypothetical protein [Halorhodospira abdelmalekii]
MDDLYRLSLIQKALDEAGVRWWIDHGTLLGLVREGRLLPWDRDVDLSLPAAGLNAAHAALWNIRDRLGAHLVRTRRNLKVLPGDGSSRDFDLACYEWVNSDPPLWRKELVMYPRLPDLHRGPLRRKLWRLLRWGEYLTGYSGQFTGTVRRRSITAGCHDTLLGALYRLREPLGVVYKSSVPAHYFAQLERLSWHELSLPIPATPEAYLAFRYGATWQSPQRHWTWWNHDASVRRD